MMLKLILIITFCAPSLSEVEHAYTGVLHYSVVGRGTVSDDLAAEWDAPKMRGHEYIVLQPGSAANIYLRFIQEAAPESYRPMSTFGWNATEMLVQDPDALAREIRQPGSGFQVVGEPRPLGAGSQIRAMQAVGPAHEVLYLTRVAAGTPPMYSARSFVDRPFIVILGSRDLDETRRFLRERLTLESSSFGPARMTVLNKAFGLDIETTHPLAVARISPEYSMELDQYPPQAAERSRRPGELPPAMAIVTFEVESLQPLKTLWLTPPRPIATAPYRGRRAVSIRGSTGELIELVEAGATLR